MNNTIRKIASFVSAVLCIAMILSLVTIAPSFAEEYDVKKEEGAIYLSDLEWSYWYMFGPCKSTDANPQYQPSKDSEEDGKPITIARTTYEKGLRTHVDKTYADYAEFVYDISAYDVNTFSAIVGKPTKIKEGSVQFYVLADEVEIGRSPVLTVGEIYQLKTVVPTGTKKLSLRVNDGHDGISNDSCIWANPIVYKAQGTKVFMETNKLVSGEELNVTVNFPADHEIKGTDWVGIYRAEADESAISANDSIGIWAYIGTGEKSAGVAESRVVELTIDDTLAEKAPSDSEIYWPLEPGDYKLLLFYEDSYVVEDAFAFTVEEGHSAPTAEPTAEPSDDPSTDATPAPSSDATAEPTAEPADKPAKKGCKSVVVSGAVVMVTLLGACVIVTKKRK